MLSPADRLRGNLASQFARLSDDATQGEWDAGCLVTQALAPELDLARLHEHAADLVNACSRPREPWIFLREQGFQGSRGDSLLATSRLDNVLATRSGIPISLGVLLIHLARAQGCETWGINFPGHFLVSVDTRLIDPFEMSEVSEADCLSRLSPPARQGAFVRAPARKVALRMLNNLKYQFASVARWDKALDMLDYQLALAPGDGAVLFERGEFWLRLGAVDAARDALEKCISSVNEKSELYQLAEEQLELMSGQHDTLH